MSGPLNKNKDWPPILSGFEHIARIWDSNQNLCASSIKPGEYYVTRNEEIITTVLGSCVSACIRDPKTGFGGMNHFMLPGEKGKPNDSWGGEFALSTRFGISAMERLINDVLKLGGTRERLECKLFGGGKVLSMEQYNIGDRNISFIRKFMKTEGLTIIAEDLGGNFSRKLKYFPRTGSVMVRRLRSLQNVVVAEEESNYETQIETKDKAGEIELFG